MKLTVQRYSWLLCFQFTLLAADLFLNTFGHVLSHNKLQTSIFFFVTQDVFIIIAYVLFTLALHSTCVYQVGATHIILRNCKLFLFSITTYFLLSASQHFWLVYNYRTPSARDAWPLALTTLTMVQRMVSILYYYSYKNVALTIADPRYNEENIDWIAEQLSNK